MLRSLLLEHIILSQEFDKCLIRSKHNRFAKLDKFPRKCGKKVILRENFPDESDTKEFCVVA
jgi:hypothetical protein